MGNLFPELRMDKNGKLVTRMVKPDDQKVVGKHIPQPKIEDAALAEKNRLDALERNAALIHKANGEDSDLNDMIDSLTYMTARTSETIFEQYHNHPEDHLFFNDLIIEHNDDEVMIRNAALLKPSFPENVDYLHVAAVVSGLRRYDFMDDDYLDDITADSDRYQQTEALCRVTSAMTDMPFYTVSHALNLSFDDSCIIDKGLVDIIMEKPERDREIIDLIEQRNMVDSTMIRQYFESPTAALRTGEL